MVKQNSDVHLIKATLAYDNLQRVKQLVKEGYSVAEAIKGMASYRVYAQNGFTDIDIASLHFGTNASGDITSLEYMVRRP
jgi:hypothetical protein